MRSREELKEVALGMKGGYVFTDRHISKDELDMLPSIFMPIRLISQEQLDEIIENLGDNGLIYEFISEAGPICINGYPIFMSMHTLTPEEYKTMLSIWEELDAI